MHIIGHSPWLVGSSRRSDHASVCHSILPTSLVLQLELTESVDCVDGGDVGAGDRVHHGEAEL